jgi:hypothetical protein
MSDKIYIGYSPTNFYYVDALTRGADYAPNDAACSYWLEGNVDLSCSFTERNPNTNNIWFADNSFNCIQKELCINKELAQSLVLENSNDGGKERYFDNNHTYYNYILKTVNLGMGICIILYLMLFRRKTSASKQI